MAAAGDVIFGVDDEAIEDAVARVLATDGLTLGLAESLTGGLAASRLVNVPGASTWFRGSVVTYASEVKFDVLGVPEGPVVSEAAARAMAEGARRVLGADVGLSVTGVAGPTEQDGQPVGTVFVGLARPGRDTVATGFAVPGDRARIRQYADHRRPRPPAPLARRATESRVRSGSGPGGRRGGRRRCGGGGDGNATGASSSHVLPGCSVIGAPSDAVSVAGSVRLRLHVP